MLCIFPGCTVRSNSEENLFFLFRHVPWIISLHRILRFKQYCLNYLQRYTYYLALVAKESTRLSQFLTYRLSGLLLSITAWPTEHIQFLALQNSFFWHYCCLELNEKVLFISFRINKNLSDIIIVNEFGRKNIRDEPLVSNMVMIKAAHRHSQEIF